MIKEAAKDIGDTEVDQIDGIFQELRTNFLDQRTQDLSFRKSMLQNVVRGMEEMEKDFLKSLHEDLRNDEASAYIQNIMMLKNEAKECVSSLSKW